MAHHWFYNANTAYGSGILGSKVKAEKYFSSLNKWLFSNADNIMTICSLVLKYFCIFLFTFSQLP